MKTKVQLKNIFSLKNIIILFILFCLCCSIPIVRDFFITIGESLINRQLRDIRKWNAVITYSARFFATVAAFIYFFAYTKKGNILYKDIVPTIKEPFLNPESKKYLLVLFIIYLVGYFSIIRANYNYEDDVIRSFAGHKSWVGSSRYISETIAIFLHTNFYLNDISPVSQIIAIAIMCVASYILAWSLTLGSVKKLTILSSALLGITPFFIENISYKFDSPYMAFSVLAGILPFIFTKSLFTFAVTSVASLLLVCSSYQASNSIYIVLAILTALNMFLCNEQWKKIGSFTLVSIASYLFALVFFSVFIMVPTSESISERSTDIVFGISLLELIKNNFIKYVCYVYRYYGNLWIKAFTAILFVLFPIAAFYKTKRNKLSSVLMAIFALTLMFALSFGAYLAIGNTLTEIRAFIGFNILVSSVAIFDVINLSNGGIRKIICATATICLLYGFIICATARGNLYAKQIKYEEFRYTILMNDLAQFTKNTTNNKLCFEGSIGITNESYREIKNYNFDIGNFSSKWEEFFIMKKNMQFEYINEIPKDKLENLQVLKDSYYHTIYANENYYKVLIKDPQITEFSFY